MEIDFKSIKKAHVYLREVCAGSLEKQATDRFVFQYSPEYLSLSEAFDISRTLKKQSAPYVNKTLHPFFDNLIPEGWLLQYTEKTFHIEKSNRFGLLMATGGAPIGAVSVRPLNNENGEINVVAELSEEWSKEYPKGYNDEKLKLYSIQQPESFPYCTTCFKPLAPNKLSHRKCVLEMWETERTLQIEMDATNPLSSFARVIYGGSISGAQKKGLFRFNSKKGLLQATASGAQYILKPAGDYPELPENEHVTMAIAKAIQFNVPPFALLQIEGLGNVFAIKRFDRTPHQTPLMMEDMGQIIQVSSADKYESSYEKVATAISKHSSAPQIDLNDFYRRLIFCYLTANADMHLKNWALLENEKALGTFKLSPCYDLLNTRLPIPRERMDLGLKMLGKDRNIQASYFIRFGNTIGLSKLKIDSVFDELPKWKETATELVQKSLLRDKSKDKYQALLKDRFTTLISR